MRFISLLLLLLCARCTDAYTFTCEEMLYHFNHGTIDDEITHACVILPDGNRNVEQLKKFHLTSRLSFADIFNAPGHCVKRANGVAWQPRVDEGAVCIPEFILIEATEQPAIITPGAEPDQNNLAGERVVLVVPQTGMWIGNTRCVGQGNVTFSTGAGIEEPGLDVTYRSWPCHSLPVRIHIFDSVVTVDVDENVQFTMQTSSYIGQYNTARPGNHFAVFSSGRSNDLQNMEGYNNHANFKMDNEDEVTVNMDLTFDSANTGSVTLKKSFGGALQNYYNGTYSENFNTKYFEVQFAPKPLKPDEIYFNQDKIVVDIYIGPQATQPPPVASKDEYCNCAVDKFGLADGWRYNDIWLDVAVVLDTSEAMGERALADASSLIESLLSDGVDDLLITDPAAEFYTRVGVIAVADSAEGKGIDDLLITDPTAEYYTRIGVIAVADSAEVLYNLNMTKADSVSAIVKNGVKEMNFEAAYSSALSMFSEGLEGQVDRVGTRQIIYVMTNSDPKGDVTPFSQFKYSQGIVIVDNFVEEGASAIAGLKDLASAGYFYTNSNYMQGLQAFCKANCFCNSHDDAYPGSDPALQASGGCYRASTTGVPFAKAKSACATDGGIIAAIHDDEKGVFLQQMMSKSASKSDYYWIGYEKSSKGEWEWEDQSTNPYTNWGPFEPSSAAVAKCAYVDATTKKDTWGAGNCQIGFPYVCEYAPCSVGRKNC